MGQRKISECISIRINVGNYQHIEITKYAEESIDFTSDADRIAKEDQLRDELVDSIVRSMKAIPSKLGKGITEAIKVEEAIQKAIPEWLAEGAVPNIANDPKKKFIQVAAKQKADKDESASNLSEITSSEENPSEEDLFEDDKMPEPEKVDGADKTVDVSEDVSNDNGTKSSDELNEFFGDDEDLFGDN